MKKIFCYGKKNEKGITLTALVITVVVLSAIAAVGLKAADSEIKSVNEIQNEAQKQEDKLENTGKQINKMYDDLNIKEVDLTANIKQTTCSFEITNVQLQNSSEVIEQYKYYIKEKNFEEYKELSSTVDNFMTIDKLKHNTQYDIKIEAYNKNGKKIKTSIKTAKTNELTAGSLILRLKNSAGAEYTPGTWTASDVYVRQVEGNSGKTTYQTVESSAQTIAQGTSGETIVSKSGVTTIRVITTDGTNTVNGKDYVIKIDKEAPISGTLKMQLDNSNGAEYKNDTWTNHDIYVSLQQGNSNLSGIKSTVYNVTGAETHTNQTQPLTLKTTGTYTINVITTNNVGTTSTKTYTVKIDKDAPEAGKLIMKLGDNKGNDYADGTWTNQNVYIALINGSDEAGGSGHSSTTYSISGAATQSNQTAAQTLTATGKYTITITTKDVAGNSSTRTQYVYIDKTKPTAGTLTMKLDSSTGSSYTNNTWTNHSVYISLNNGSDETNGSGHSSTTYSISGSATQSNQTAAQTLSATGTYNITVTTKDKAGNTATNNYVIKIDKTVPNVGKLTMKLDSASGEDYTNNTWTNHNIYIAVNNGNDANSGHQSTTYSISGPITVTNSSAARTLTAEGTYTVVLTTKDMAGNTATRTYTIKKRKIPKVGEIVNYTPDTPSTGYDLSAAKSGRSIAQTIDDKYDPKVWKIMEVDENGNITKLFGVPSRSQSTVSFGGSTGYNNGVYLLNDICRTRYGNASLGATARSLTIEDIESRMNSKGIAARNAYKAGTVQYGTTRKYTYTHYPALYAQEKYSGVDVSDVTDGTQVITGSVDTTAQSKMNPSGKTQSEDVYTAATTDTSKTASTTLTCTQTSYYFYSTLSSYFDDSNFYNMIFGTGTYFWLASRYVGCGSDGSSARFGLRHVASSTLTGNALFYSSSRNYGNDNRLGPVVSLGSGVQVKSGSGTESDPYAIGK